MREHSTLSPSEEQRQVEYREIPGFPYYRVGDDGSVWTRRGWHGRPGPWRRLKGYLRGSKRPRPAVLLYHNGRHRFFIHRLVLEAFVGPCLPGLEACHNDGNCLNNRLTNLRWDSRAANDADKERHGTVLRGEAHPRAKLTAQDVQSIRHLVALGVFQREIATRFGVGQQVVSRIARKLLWASLPEEGP